jgi:hypothetical protein
MSRTPTEPVLVGGRVEFIDLFGESLGSSPEGVASHLLGCRTQGCGRHPGKPTTCGCGGEASMSVTSMTCAGAAAATWHGRSCRRAMSNGHQDTWSRSQSSASRWQVGCPADRAVSGRSSGAVALPSPWNTMRVAAAPPGVAMVSPVGPAIGSRVHAAASPCRSWLVPADGWSARQCGGLLVGWCWYGAFSPRVRYGAVHRWPLLADRGADCPTGLADSRPFGLQRCVLSRAGCLRKAGGGVVTTFAALRGAFGSVKSRALGT